MSSAEVAAREAGLRPDQISTGTAIPLWNAAGTTGRAGRWPTAASPSTSPTWCGPLDDDGPLQTLTRLGKPLMAQLGAKSLAEEAAMLTTMFPYGRYVDAALAPHALPGG